MNGPDGPPATSLFAEVVGQPQAVATLRAAARRPVHAYLFVGTTGSGSRPAARAFAAALLCPTGGCGRCDTCRQALAGTHPDLVIVERTGAALGVDDARRLVLLAQRRPLVAERQVVVVNDVHLAIRSAPALLKTVEEPPSGTVFVLLCEEVPPELGTVASRCVEVRFPPISSSAVETWLAARGVDRDRAKVLAEGSGGDLERARLLAEDDGFVVRYELWRSVPGRLTGDGAVAAALARELLAASDAAVAPLRDEHARELAELTAQSECLGERSAPGRRELLERHHREERRWRTDELRAGLGVLARAYRDRLAGALASGRDGDEVERCCRATEIITQAAASLERNPNEPLMLEALLLQLTRLGQRSA